MSVENLFVHSLASHTPDDFIINFTFPDYGDGITRFMIQSWFGSDHRNRSAFRALINNGSIFSNGTGYGIDGFGLNQNSTTTDTIDDDENLSAADESLAAFIHAIDICLAFFSGLNFIVNLWLLILCSGFVRNGCSSCSDSSERRPHYGLHLFIFNCALSSVFLVGVGSLTNIGYLFVGKNIFIMAVESEYNQQIIRKSLDFITYGLFNVSHLNFVLLLNVDKLLYILRPLHYHEAMSRRRVCVICVGTWAAALAMASPSLTYVDVNAQLRQEAILFAMCVVCPAGFDLLSAIIVSTIVFRIQLQDNSTRRSVMGPRRSQRDAAAFVPSVDGAGSISMNGTSIRARGTRKVANRLRTIRGRPGLLHDVLRHLNVFLRTFTPIIWTCVTTLPYTSTMIYLYFGSDGDEDFIRRWTDDTTFKVLRAFGCLYITYFTGIPFIIVFNYYPYRRKIKAMTRLTWKRLHSLHRRVCAHRYASVAKHDHVTNYNLTTSTGADLLANNTMNTTL